MSLNLWFGKILSLFREKPVSSEAGTEMMVRSREFKQRYRDWVNSGQADPLLQNLYTSATLGNLGLRGEMPMHCAKTSEAQVLVLHYMERYGKEGFAFLMDYFRDRLLRKGFQVSQSDRRMVQLEHFVARTERHVLRNQIPPQHVPEGTAVLPWPTVEILVYYADERPVYLEINAHNPTSRIPHGINITDDLADVFFV